MHSEFFDRSNPFAVKAYVNCPRPSVGAGFFISSCNDGSDPSLRLPTVGAGRRLHARFRSANEEQWSNLRSLSGRRAASRKKPPPRRDGDDSMPASTMVAFPSKSQIGDRGQGNNKSESTPRPSVPGAGRRSPSGIGAFNETGVRSRYVERIEPDQHRRRLRFRSWTETSNRARPSRLR